MARMVRTITVLNVVPTNIILPTASSTMLSYLKFILAIRSTIVAKFSVCAQKRSSYTLQCSCSILVPIQPT